MKKIFALVFFVILSLPKGFSQTIDEKWVKENYVKKEYKIEMRDGVKLFTAVHMPKNANEKNPILMVRSPYSCAPYGETEFSPRLWLTYWKNYIKENYILVVQDVRGRWMSEGEFVDVRPFIENKKTKKDIDEASDTYDAIEWLIKNIPNNNGNVGVFGISYPGFYSTMAALSNHPALKAVSPQAPVTEWFLGDDFHHNGAFMMMDAFNFYSGFGKPRPKPTTIGRKGFDYPIQDNYKFYLETGSLKSLTKLLGDSITFWNELMNHPNYDDWWKARDARRACTKVSPAMLIVGGLFDAEDCYGAWNLYKSIEKNCKTTNNKLVMGPWSHGGWSRTDGSYLGNVRFGSKTSDFYQQTIELPFFNYYLKGKGSVQQIAEASIFISGINEWRKFNEWPPASVENKSIYLQDKNKLSFNSPQENSSFTEYTSDPNKPVPYSEGAHQSRTNEYMTDDQRFAARRTDVIVFETDILNEDLTLAGVITANLKVAISTTDADFVVKVIDVFPNKFKYDSTYCCEGTNWDARMAGGKKGNYLMDNYQMLVRGEIMRGKFRNSFEKPETFKPGEITTVKFDLPDVAHTFKAGHKLMIQIQSSWFPLADRNPQQFIDIYHCDEKDFVKSDIKVYHDKVNASSIVLPVLK
ncbi:MAG TPA: CocE/NonD family hydrolase [Bacteroidia bacterium]|jgi:putative CocE/NonD family hydrolase|nr:CocE/NonD family hydrolase [Bacteroidia bacterium]